MKTYAKMICECKTNDKDASILSFIGSDATVDRAGEIMTLGGWKTENYKKNPVFLWAHNYSYPPIGKAVRVELTEKGLEFDIQFVPKEVDPFADQVRQLYIGKYLNATSVGFLPSKRESNPDGTIAITEKELLELSAVPVPCNPNALQMALEKGVIDQKGLEKLTEKTSEDEIKALTERVGKCEAEISAIREQIKGENQTATETNSADRYERILFGGKGNALLSDQEMDTLRKFRDKE